jgi:hypothetical protein
LGIAAFLSKAELCTQTGSQAGAWEPEEKTVFGFRFSGFGLFSNADQWIAFAWLSPGAQGRQEKPKKFYWP